MINLYLMTLKGLRVLEFVVREGHAPLIGHVTVGKDANTSGDCHQEIIALCKANGIAYADQKTPAPKSDYSIAVSWRWMLEADNLIVLHDSLLPKYRGFAPLVNSLKNGEPEIGVTALFASSEYDKGDIICQSSTPVNYPIKIADAIEKVTANYVAAVAYIFEKLKNGDAPDAAAQDESQATYSLWLDDEDYKIDWSKDSQYIKRFIDAVGTPYGGARTTVENREIVVHDAVTAGDLTIENRCPGKIIFFQDGFPVIVCGEGLLKITEADYVDSGESIFPLKKFRLRFKP